GARSEERPREPRRPRRPRRRHLRAPRSLAPRRLQAVQRSPARRHARGGRAGHHAPRAPQSMDDGLRPAGHVGPVAPRWVGLCLLAVLVLHAVVAKMPFGLLPEMLYACHVATAVLA